MQEVKENQGKDGGERGRKQRKPRENVERRLVARSIQGSDGGLDGMNVKEFSHCYILGFHAPSEEIRIFTLKVCHFHFGIRIILS